MGRMDQSRRISISLAAVAVAHCLTAASVRAQNNWIDSTAGSVNWSDPTQWDTNGVPASGTSTVVNFLANATVLPNSGLTATNDLTPSPFVLNQLNLYGTSSGGTGTITIAGTPLQFDGTSPSLNFYGAYGAGSGTTYTLNNNLTFNAETAIHYGSNGGNLNVNGTISGSGTIDYTGPSFRTLTFGNAASTYTGNVNLLSGYLALSANNALGSGTNTINVSSGAALVLEGYNLTVGTLNQNLILSGTGLGLGAVQLQQNPEDYYNNSNGLTLGGTVTLAGNTALGGNTTTNTFVGWPTAVGDLLKISGLVSGNYGITKVGNSVLQLTNASNTYSGGTNISAGTVVFNTGITAPSTGASIFGTGGITLNGGTLRWTGGDNAFYNSPGLFNTTITLGPVGGTFDTNTGYQLFGNFALAGSGTLTKIGTRNLLLNASSPTFTGNVLINQGGIQLWNGGALGTNAGTGTVTVASGAHLDFAGYNNNAVGTFTQNLILSGVGDGNGALQVAQDPYDYNNNAAPVTQAGTVTLASDTAIGGTTTVHNGTGDGLKISGPISGGFGLTKVGNSILFLAGTNTYTGSTSINAGILTVTATGSTVSPNFNVATGTTFNVIGTLSNAPNVTVNGAANFAASPGTGLLVRTLGNLTIASAATVTLAPATVHANHTLLTVAGLSIAGTSGSWSGQLDLGNNDLDVQNGNITTIVNQVTQGLNAAGGGTWNGPNGIISTSAAADTRRLTALGVIQNSVNGNPSGAALYGSGTAMGLFDGANPASTDVLVKYTYYGDANLDGKVDGSDYSRIDAAFGTSATGWYNGDFNYDGVINGSDYTLIDNAFNTQRGSLASEIAGPSAVATAQIAEASGSSSVPEPASFGFLTIAAVGLLGRRKLFVC